jgi:hypothetical protein
MPRRARSCRPARLELTTASTASTTRQSFRHSEQWCDHRCLRPRAHHCRCRARRPCADHDGMQPLPGVRPRSVGVLHSERAEHARMPAGPARLDSAVLVRKALPVCAEERHRVYSGIVSCRWQSAPGSARPRRASGREHLGARGYTQKTSRYSEDCRHWTTARLLAQQLLPLWALSDAVQHGCVRHLRFARTACDPWLSNAALVWAWRLSPRAV